jgi:hypothetical protein
MFPFRQTEANMETYRAGPIPGYYRLIAGLAKGTHSDLAFQEL